MIFRSSSEIKDVIPSSENISKSYRKLCDINCWIILLRILQHVTTSSETPARLSNQSINYGSAQTLHSLVKLNRVINYPINSWMWAHWITCALLIINPTYSDYLLKSCLALFFFFFDRLQVYLNASQKCIAKSISEVSSSNGKNKPTALLVLNSSKEKQAFFLPRNTYLKDHIRQLKMFTFFFSFPCSAQFILYAGSSHCTGRLRSCLHYKAAMKCCRTRAEKFEDVAIAHGDGPWKETGKEAMQHLMWQPKSVKHASAATSSLTQENIPFWTQTQSHACFELQYTIQQVPGELKWYLM